MKDLIRLARPHQYFKNGFVWLGALFSERWDIDTLVAVSIAFLAFCAASSAVYVFNDILDIESDRRHPVKCTRPIASGRVTLRAAWLISGLFAIIAAALGFWVGYWALALIGAYLVINIGYSWRLKHVVILDVFIISAGFMLRILVGTIGIGIEPSQWLLLTGLMLTLFLGFAKRRAELLLLERANKSDHVTVRRVLDAYNPAILDLFIAITAACTILSYGLYTVSPETVAVHGTTNLFYTLPFVVYGILRYVFLLHRRSMGHDTAGDFLADRHLLLTVSGWLVVTLWVLA
jgi:4-hydroxybenzoate polyprenyltransferase